MINFIKSKLYPSNEYITALFSFRDKKFQIQNLVKLDEKPYLGCKLNRDAVLLLVDWLNRMLAENELCDDCYNYKPPPNFKGELICKNCNYVKNYT